jgi:hypothetical protein
MRSGEIKARERGNAVSNLYMMGQGQGHELVDSLV